MKKIILLISILGIVFTGQVLATESKKSEKDLKAGYRLCPDGQTMVRPGQKCPEKAKKAKAKKSEKDLKIGYRLCPDGQTMVRPGQKCPEKVKK